VPNNFEITVTTPAPVVVGVLPDFNVEDSETITIPTAQAFNDGTDGDRLQFIVSGLPPGLLSDDNTGEITGTLPNDASQNAPYTVTVTVEDEQGATAQTTFTLNVANIAPVATDLPDRSGTGGVAIAPINVASAITDPDGDTITYSATGMPPGLTMNPATGVISGTPDPTLLPGSVFAILITASDPDGGSVNLSFNFTINQLTSNVPVNPSPIDGFFGRDLFSVLGDGLGGGNGQGQILIDSLENIQSIGLFAALDGDQPILNSIEAMNKLTRSLDMVTGAGFTNTFPIGFALASDTSEASGLVANVMIGDERVLYQIEALDGRTITLVEDALPPGVLVSSDGVILMPRWINEPFTITVEAKDGETVEVLDIHVDPKHHELEIQARELRGLLTSERLNWTPAIY